MTNRKKVELFSIKLKVFEMNCTMKNASRESERERERDEMKIKNVKLLGKKSFANIRKNICK